MTVGQHTVEMRFFPAGLALGMVLSAVGIVIVVLMGIYERKHEKRLLDRVYEEGDDGEQLPVVPEAETVTEKAEEADENGENNE